jgi:hypothetical protein
MSRRAIKDRSHRILGYVETMSDGRQKALDVTFRTLGYYDPRRDVTQDASYRVISHGNVLAALILDTD